MTDGPRDLETIAEALECLDLDRQPSFEEAMASSRELGRLGDRDVGLARFHGQPPWERHEDDELLLVRAGEFELTLLRGEAEETHRLHKGQLFIVPAGVWHRSRAESEVTLLYVTPREGNRSSHEERPPKI